MGELYAVGDVIEARRADDPLAPVLVVARDRIHAELLGRRLATAGIGALSPGAQGTFGVRVGTVEDVAEKLLATASPATRTRTADPASVADALQQALIRREDLPPWLEASRGHWPSVLRLGSAMLTASLQTADGPPFGRLPLADEFLRTELAPTVEEVLDDRGLALPGRQLAHAATVARATNTATLQRWLGHVVLTEGPFSPAASALVDVLTDASVLSRVRVEDHASKPTAGSIHVVPDATSEARLAVGLIASWLRPAAGGAPPAAEDIAIVVPPGSTYTSLVADALKAHGIPHWNSTGPAGIRLGTTTGWRLADLVTRCLTPALGCRACEASPTRNCELCSARFSDVA